MACDFRKNKDQIMGEFESYYAKMPFDTGRQQKQLDEWLNEKQYTYSYEKKALVYQAAAELCNVHVFHGSPFFFEIESGRERNTSQNGYPPGPGLEGWFTRKTQPMMDDFQVWMKELEENDLVWGSVFVDMAHHTMGYERVLKEGFIGIERKALERLATEEDEKKKAYYRATLSMCQSMRQIAKNFADEARAQMEKEENPEYLENLKEIAQAAEVVPYHPANSFYEALCTILFIKEMAIDLEGVAVAVMGHIDRILYPFYERDIKDGTLTYEKAKNYMAHWLSHTDGRWDLYGNDFASTNCSITIGGCDSQGNIIWNDITRMILEAYDENGFVNPKVQARVTLNHPKEFIEKCANMVIKGENIFSFLNDDVIIQSNVKMGKKLEDARLYSAGGCQEPVLDDKEFNSRAFIYISLPQLVNLFMFGDLQKLFKDKCGYSISDKKYTTFEEFYDEYIQCLSILYQALVTRVNHYEKGAAEYNPCILISSTLEGCLECGKDMMEGGTVYGSTSIPLVGVGTAINSLLAIQQLVFDEKKLTLDEYTELLESDYTADQRMRDYIVNKCPKYGDGKAATENFASRVFADIARVTSGYENARHGKYEASLFVFYLFDWMKNHLKATPDGRLAGNRLSRGMNPTELSGISNVANILSTVQNIDMTDFPGAGVIYLEMPLSTTTIDQKYVEETIRAFIRVGGSALDLNLLDGEKLRKAKENPEEYKHIVVRVCVFSAYFTSLDPEIQDEVIGRIFVNG